MIDQHALHERVMFEELRKRILEDKSSLESQRLLMPDVVKADDARQVGARAERTTVLRCRRMGQEALLGPHPLPLLLLHCLHNSCL